MLAPFRCITVFPAYSDTLRTWERCHCNQIVTVTRGSVVINQSFGTCQKCHSKRGVTVNSVTVSGEICIASTHNSQRTHRGGKSKQPSAYRCDPTLLSHLHPTSSFAPPVACLLDGMACPTQGPFPGRKSRVKDDELGSQVKLGKMLGHRARKFKSFAQGYDAHQAEVKKSILTRFSKSIQVVSSQKH